MHRKKSNNSNPIKTGSTEQYAIAFKLGNTELRDQVQATLDEMLEDGTFDEIVANYSDYNLDKMVCLGK